MILSRASRKTKEESDAQSKAKQIVPTFEQLIGARDYTGAFALLEFNSKSGKIDTRNELWKAFCHFRLAEYKKALDVYKRLAASKEIDAEICSAADLMLFTACCRFYAGDFIEPHSLDNYAGAHESLCRRIKIYVNRKKDFKEDSMDEIQAQLNTNNIEDQLCLASVHFYRHQYQEAIDIYKKILLEKKHYAALNIYIALCYYKLDYYDVSQEVLTLYMQKNAPSIIAGNLKACNNYRLFNGSAAENELRNLIESFPANFCFARDLIRHNLVVFRNGEGAFQVLPLLMNSIPEAKLNLIIYYLKNDKNEEASSLIKDIEPKLPNEYILKAIVNANLGQNRNSHEHLKLAQNFFQLIGSSPAECDTIQGRQCMASYFFLVRQFEEVGLYLSSIKSYFYNDDTFNFNYGQAKMMTYQFREAEEAFLLVESDKLKSDLVYICSLTRCLIMNKKANKAWEIFLKYQHTKESTILLHLIANDCYKMGQFLVALRAFDILEKMDQSPEYWEGKRGAAAGVMQMVIAGDEPIEQLYDAIKILRTSNNPQANQIINIMKSWPTKENV